MKRCASLCAVVLVALAIVVPAAPGRGAGAARVRWSRSRARSQVGTNGVWQPAAAKMQLFDGQVPAHRGGLRVRDPVRGRGPAKLGEKVEIAVADLLLKARLEQTKAKISAPADATKAEMQVTPMTGVRGTEKTEEKAGDLKREHYWNEGAPAAK